MGFQNAVVPKVLEDLGEERPREMEVLGQIAGKPIGAVIRKPDKGLEGVPRWRVEQAARMGTAGLGMVHEASRHIKGFCNPNLSSIPLQARPYFLEYFQERRSGDCWFTRNPGEGAGPEASLLEEGGVNK
jgi:hypothetical protein